MFSSVKKSTALGLSVMLAFVLTITSFVAVGAPSAYAEDYPTSQEITISVQGEDIDPVTFTKDDLEGDLNDGVLGYLYRKPDGQWYTVALKDYITIDDLFAKADVSDYWTVGAELQFVGTDGVYTKYFPTYEECMKNQEFFGFTTAKTPVPVATDAAPAALGFSYSQTEIGADENATQSLGGDGWIESTRFGIGLNADTLMVEGGDANMGKRMPYDLTDIIIIPA